MSTIDDSNTTPPGYWFAELDRRLRDRLRDELHDLDLGRRGWRILRTLADGPATADELTAALPYRRRGGRTRRDAGSESREAGSESREAGSEGREAGSEGRDPEGRPEWMRREWERRQQLHREWMHREWMARERMARGGPGSEHGVGYQHPHHGDEHHGDEHADHEHADHHDHHEHHEHGTEPAFERGFERGFLRGFERGAPFGRAGFRPDGYGHGMYGHGMYGQGMYGHGMYAHGMSGNGMYGHTAPGGRPGYRDRCGGGIARVLADFVERGWVWFDDDRATLTDEGRAAYDAASERIRAARATLSEGIDPADLATTLATLQAMARNLGWAPAAEPDSGQPAPEAAD